MTIDKQTFQNLFTALMEQFRWKFSTPAIAEYYQHLSPKLETEAFEAAVKHIFINSEKFDRFPSPNQILEVARGLMPVKTYVLPESTYKTLAEMTPEEREVSRKAIAAANEVVRKAVAEQKASRSGFSSLASQLGNIVPNPQKSLEQQIEEKRNWLKSGDRVLTKEAMDWILSHKYVSPVMDEIGNIVDFEVKEDSRNPGN